MSEPPFGWQHEAVQRRGLLSGFGIGVDVVDLNGGESVHSGAGGSGSGSFGSGSDSTSCGSDGSGSKCDASVVFVVIGLLTESEFFDSDSVCPQIWREIANASASSKNDISNFAFIENGLLAASIKRCAVRISNPRECSFL